MFLESVKIAARSMTARRGRSFLTLSTIAIGCFAMVLATSLAESGFASLKHTIELLGGARLVMIDSQPPKRAEKKQRVARTGIDEGDRDALRQDVPHVDGFSHLSPLEEKDVLADSGKSTRADLVAVDSGFFDVFRMRVEAGRPLDDADDREAANVCVVGPKVAAALWTGSPLGRKLEIADIRCRVVGLFADNEHWGSQFGFGWNELVAIPFRTVAYQLPDARQHAGFMIRTTDRAYNDIVKRIVNARLETRHAGIDDFVIYDFAKTMDRFEVIFGLIKVLVGLFAGISLAIGGAGIMNMMLVSVSERTKEIGVRKALGATPSDLSAQFLIESSMLSGVGGLLGVAAGLLVAIGSGFAIRHALSGWVPALSYPAAVFALVAATVTGVAFGWLPAKKAARLDPVEALRR